MSYFSLSNLKVPSHINKAILLEIFNFSNKRYNEAIFESQVRVIEFKGITLV